MYKAQEKIFELIKFTASIELHRKQWFGPEMAELGLKHHGLDDIPLDSVLILAVLQIKGTLDDQEIHINTDLDLSKIADYIDDLKSYKLIIENPSSGKYELTEKGSSACHDIFRNFVIRSRFELKRNLEVIEPLYLEVTKSQAM